jgi:DNA-binding NtrC family response regulator
MLSGERLLIVEEEFLIALDIQRVLEDAHAAKAVFARNYKELTALERRFAEFDLAIVTPPKPGTSDAMLLERLAQSGPALVICSATHVRASEGNLASAEIVYKPFSDDDLLDACKRALASRKAGLSQTV